MSSDEAKRWFVGRIVVLACVVAITALTSERSDWQPPALAIALIATMIIADAATFTARRIRISAGLMVQTTIMALLGAGPAVTAGMASTLVEARINRCDRYTTANNFVVFSVLGLVGGVMFEGLRDALGLERSDVAYAALVMPAYIVLSALNLLLVVADHPAIAPGSRLRVVRESVASALPLELTNAVLTAVAVLVWAEAGIVAAATILLVLALMIPLARTVAEALKRSDDLVELRQVSDARAAEVARLSQDRHRLLSEVLDAEQRERGRLAASLHDGPMQRLMALRQDSDPDTEHRRELDQTIAETRAIISAFHPATVRQLGFEASLRAAIAPFPTARSVRLTVSTAVDDRALAGSLLLPVAEELVVNAVKHADPTVVAVAVTEDADSIAIEVNDDGVGIDSERAGRAVQAGHVGLAMVRRRVEDAGGVLDIATRDDGGTRSLIVMPTATALE